MEDIAGFLAAHPPFDAVDADELARVAAVTETETFPAGKTIFSQGTGPGRVPPGGPRRLGRDHL
jgi:CBS domain-containing protein